MSLNRPQLEPLIHLLHQELQAYKAIEQKMAEKKRVLIQGDTDALSRVDQALMALGQKTIEIEEKRLKLMKTMGTPSQTLQGLIDGLDAEQASPLVEARQRLLRTVDSIRDLNQQNQSLLDLSINWIASTVDTIARHLTPESSCYNAKGVKKGHVVQGDQSLLGNSTVEHKV